MRGWLVAGLQLVHSAMLWRADAPGLCCVLLPHTAVLAVFTAARKADLLQDSS